MNFYIVPFFRLDLKKDVRNFDLKKLAFDNMVQTKCFDDIRVKGSLLQEMTNDQRLNLCDAARSFYKGKGRSVFYDITVERPEIFKIEYKGEEEERVTMKCPCSPPMFVRFKNLRINEDVRVIFF